MINKKDFTTMYDIDEKNIYDILNTADTMKLVLKNTNKKAPHLQGRSVITMYADSLPKDKLAFELASQFLSANVADFTSNNMMDIYSNVMDLGKSVEQMGADFIIVRHNLEGTANFLASRVSASVINAGDGKNENPVSALLDLMDIRKIKGGFDGLNVTFIGDIENNATCKSDVYALIKLGAKVTLCAPPTLVNKHFAELGIKITNNPYEAVEGADVVIPLALSKNVDLYKYALPSIDEYKKMFKLTSSMLELAHKDAVVIHNRDVRRGIEISSKIEVANKEFMDDQISNSVSLKMALLYLLSNRR